MARMGRPGMSRAQKRDLWRRWKGGQSLSDIARFFDKNPGSIFGVLPAQGGIAPRERRRSARSLSLMDREEISRCLASGQSFRQIALSLGRPTSTISREVARHGEGTHSPSTATRISVEASLASSKGSCVLRHCCDLDSLKVPCLMPGG